MSVRFSIKNILLLIILAVIVSLGVYGTAKAAYSGTVYGAAHFQQYFSGTTITTVITDGLEVLPRIYSNCYDGEPVCAIPTYINTVGDTSDLNSFVGIIYSAYVNRSPVSGATVATQRRYGAAFIVNTFLGRNMQPVNGTTISAADWSAFKDKLDRSTVEFGIANLSNQDGADCINSTYINNGTYGPDNFFYSNAWSCHTTGRHGIRITDAAGGIYRLWNLCANPVGRSPAPTSWTATPSASVSTSSAPVGSRVDWYYSVIVSGVSTTDADVEYGYTDPFTGAPVVSNMIWAGARNGERVDYSFSGVLRASDLGRTLCSQASVDPHSSIDRHRFLSNNACVTVTAPIPNPNVCRPIKVVIPAATYYPTVSTSWSYRNNTGSRQWNGRVIPIVLYVDGSEVARNTSSVSTMTFDITTRCTDGNTHRIFMKETEKHVTSFTVNTSINHDADLKVYWDVAYCSGIPRSCSIRTRWRWTHPDDYTQYVSVTTNYSGPNTYAINIGDTPSSLLGSNIGPCFDYVLSPSNGSSFGSRREADEIISMTPWIDSNSWTRLYDPTFWNSYHTHTKSKSTNWQITKLTVIPGRPLPPTKLAGQSGSPCSFYDPSNQYSCSVQSSGTTVYNTSLNQASGASLSYTVPDLPAGTKICFAFSVYPSQSDPTNNSPWPGPSDQWLNSGFNPVNNCIIIVKKPKIQVLGGDLVTMGGVDTSTTTKMVSGVRRTFGSWGEYAIIPRITANGIASASAFSGGMPNISSVCDYSQLTFINAPGGSCNASSTMGNFQSTHTLPKIEEIFPASNASNTFSGGDLSGLSSGLYKTNGDVTIAGGDIGIGKWVVINASNSTVTISGDIKYSTSPMHAIGDIPQVIIIANRIIVSEGVANIDSWLVAKGTVGSIDTCSIAGDTINKCKTKLTVNGPVMAQKIYLRRTAGSGTGMATADPAEVFNLRADAYIWVYYRGATKGQVQTTYSTETTPRL